MCGPTFPISPHCKVGQLWDLFSICVWCKFQRSNKLQPKVLLLRQVADISAACDFSRGAQTNMACVRELFICEASSPGKHSHCVNLICDFVHGTPGVGLSHGLHHTPLPPHLETRAFSSFLFKALASDALLTGNWFAPCATMPGDTVKATFMYGVVAIDFHASCTQRCIFALICQTHANSEPSLSDFFLTTCGSCNFVFFVGGHAMATHHPNLKLIVLLRSQPWE